MLFKPSKAKSFNFKPVYLKEQDENSTNKNIDFADKMAEQWNRIPYSKLAKKGKKRLFSVALMTIAAIYFVAKAFEYLNQYQ